jgi:hypothetical protein
VLALDRDESCQDIFNQQVSKGPVFNILYFNRILKESKSLGRIWIFERFSAALFNVPGIYGNSLLLGLI